MRGRPNTALASLALWLGLSCAVLTPVAAAAEQTADKAIMAEPASEAVAQIAQWVIASGDARGLPFAVIDKVAAEVAVFAADGQPLGAEPALLGLARGDESVPGIGDRPLSSITPEERTTPAGRFLAAYGPATGGKTVLWVDYATAVSMHPVVTTNRKEQRLKRLASATPEDNRITYGCINVSADFYEAVVRPTFTGAGGVVYVLPDSTPLAQVLPAFKPQLAAVSTP
jgi:hypothetical protein